MTPDLRQERVDRALRSLRTSLEATRETLCTALDNVCDAVDALSQALAAPQSDAPAVAHQLTLDDVASALQVSRTHVRRLVDSGELHATEIPSGRGDRPMLRFDAQEVNALIVRHRSAA